MPISYSKPKSTYLLPLDGIRGLAIIGVLFCHLTVFGPQDVYRQYPLIQSIFWSGWIGVDLFFVLSGFLITGILLDQKASLLYFKPFYIRRILRIFPVYYFALITIVSVACLFSYEYLTIQNSGLREDIILQMGRILEEHIIFWFYLQNWLIFFSGQASPFLFHFWSLAIEEQFYLLWPIVIRKMNTRQVITTSTIILAISAPLRVILFSYGDYSSASIYTATICRLEGFMVGALAAILFKYHGGYEQNKWLIPVGILSGIGVSLVIYLDGGMDFRNLYMTVVGYTFLDIFFGVFLLFAISTGVNRWLYGVVCNRFTRFFGKYSYSIYVFHPWIIYALYIVMMWMTFEKTIVTTTLFSITAVGLTVLWSIVLWHLFEKRFLTMKSKYLYT
ncbi:MAG: acyltransferase [Gemmatimonadota bacterium]|nr:acyltransferase [Gemmatimonadota bacterium]